MKTGVKIFTISLLFLLLSSCAKRAGSIDPAFIGIWSGNDGVSSYRLSIGTEGSDSWVKSTRGSYVSVEGIARVRGNELRIGFKRLYIDTYPTLDSVDHTWNMTLSGVLYTK